MAHKEAFESTGRILIDQLEVRAKSGCSRDEYLKSAKFTAGVFWMQADHLKSTAGVLLDQTLDLYAKVCSDLKKEKESSLGMPKLIRINDELVYV